MGKQRMKPNNRRRVLRLPDLDHCKIAVLNSLGSPASRRVYEYAIDQFITWYCSEPRLAFNRIVVVRYRMYLESRRLAANTINQQLAAVRRLGHEAADTGLLSPELAAGISRVKGVKQLGFRSGNWLSVEQSSEVLKHACGDSMRAKRDYAMLAMLFGCGFRRSELVGLELDDIQMRQRHWAVVDLIGKGGHIRTVPIPAWVKAALDQWARAANIGEGKIFRRVARLGKVWGRGLSQNVVWYVVRTCCQRAGLEHIAPHDLRRTCAKLCHDRGGELEQIQFLLGHASVQTTERYLGCKQNLGHAVSAGIIFVSHCTPIESVGEYGRCNRGVKTSAYPLLVQNSMLHWASQRGWQVIFTPCRKQYKVDHFRTCRFGCSHELTKSVTEGNRVVSNPISGPTPKVTRWSQN